MELVLCKSATDTSPGIFIKFLADTSVLADFGKEVNAAFHAETSEQGLEQLPPGKLKDKILALTGRQGKKRIKLDHIKGSVLEFQILRRKNLEIATQAKDQLMVQSIDPASLVMRSDFDANPITGALEACLSIVAQDLHDVGNGIVMVGPSYSWAHQYAKHFRSDELERLLYDLDLPSLQPDGTKVGDVLRIQISSPSQPPRFKDNTILSAFTKVPGNHDIVLAGEFGLTQVRTGCGISFTFDHFPHELREMASGFGNPYLRVCHGFVVAIASDDKGETVLSVRLAWARGNLPSFCKWPRLNHYGLFQSNLEAVVPVKCVIASFVTKPMCLHSLSGLTSESKHPYGAEPSPFDYDPFIAGHLQFELGEFKVSGSAESAQSGQRVPAGNGDWKTRYDEHNTKVRAFSLYSDFCARGDKISLNN